jgi:hypothetical protein
MVSLIHTGEHLGYVGELEPLFELLDQYHLGQCSNPRDRIFSLLSMASDKPQGHGECRLRANYQMTYDGVAVRTVIHCGWAVLGDKHDSGSGFQHPVELLIACSKNPD